MMKGGKEDEGRKMKERKVGRKKMKEGKKGRRKIKEGR